MAKNTNGKNEITIKLPCCNDEEWSTTYKTDDNLFPYQIFRLMAERVGLKASFRQEKEGEVTIEKGGGDP
jgi:hypothetical protein